MNACNALFYCKIYNSLHVIWHKTLTNRRSNHISDHLEYVTIIVGVWASQVALVVKNHPANAEDKETQVRSLCQDDPLEKGMATHSIILAWRIPWTEDPVRLQSKRLRVRQDWSDLGCMHACISHVWFSVTPWTAGRQAPLSMGFSRQEYWSRLPCPSPGHLPGPGIEHRPPTL